MCGRLFSDICQLVPLTRQVAYNFGVSILRMVRSAGYFTPWLQANDVLKFYTPGTLTYGLGLPYLALAGRVECFEEASLVPSPRCLFLPTPPIHTFRKLARCRARHSASV